MPSPGELSRTNVPGAPVLDAGERRMAKLLFQHTPTRPGEPDAMPAARRGAVPPAMTAGTSRPAGQARQVGRG